MDNLNIMVEAKKEYLGSTLPIMCPAMIEVFQDMYDEAVKLSKGRKTLIMFQNFSRKFQTGRTPCLSNTVITSRTDVRGSMICWRLFCCVYQDSFSGSSQGG